MSTQELRHYPARIPHFPTGWEIEMGLRHNLKLIVRNSSRVSPAYMWEAQMSGLLAISRARKLIPIRDTIIGIDLLNPPKSGEGVVTSDPSVGGQIEDDGKVSIKVRSSSPVFKKIHRTSIQGSIAHELHHSVRMRGPGGFRDTLLQMLISEGLALCFSEDYFGKSFRLSHLKGITEQEVRSYWNKIKDRGNERVSYQNWFGGFAEKGFPHQIGYLLGHYFIRNYLRTHPHVTSASLVQVPAERFRTR